jgi:hypothetical protein
MASLTLIVGEAERGTAVAEHEEAASSDRV